MPFQIVKLTDPINITNIPGGLVPKGAYVGATDYAVGDSVDYLGSSYVMFVDAVAGTLPTDTTKWQVLANKGTTGTTGATGSTGATGAGGVVQSVVAGTNITVNNTDPANPIVNSSGGGSGTPAVSVTDETTYGITPATGVGTNYARQDHTHGSPATPTKTTVGLANVDNTSDANKPVSTAQQTALDNKQPLDSDLTTIAGLTATTDNFLVSTASAWASRTPTQARTQLGLGTLATQSGTFSGTSSGTNTGDVANTALTTNKLSVFANTTSAELAGVISDETGTGSLVFNTSPSITTPTITTPTVRDWDGWVDANETFTYVSADSPIFVAKVSGDKTAKYGSGVRIKTTQTNANQTAYYKFDTGALTTDSSAGAHTLTAVGSPSEVTGKFGKAASFGGTSDAYTAVDHADFKPAGSFSIGCWFKSSTTSTTQFLFQSYSANTNIAGIRLFISSTNALGFTIGKNTGSVSGTDYTQPTSQSSVAGGLWHFGVVTYDGAYAKVYVDGKIESSVAWTGNPGYAGTNYVRVGCGNNSGSNLTFLNGTIDDLFLLNGTALTEGQIYALYKQNTAIGTAVNMPQQFLVHGNYYDGTDTFLQLYGGDSFTLANATISNPYYSTMFAPVGFLTQPLRWSVNYVVTSSNLQALPSASTFYYPGTLSLDFPIGSWVGEFGGSFRSQSTAAQTSCQMFVRLNGSTSTSVLSDPFNSTPEALYDQTKMLILVGGASATVEGRLPGLRKFRCTVKVKATIYLMTHTNSAAMSSIGFDSGNTNAFVRLTSAYLGGGA